MSRAVAVATLLALSAGAVSGQALGVLRITVTLSDGTGVVVPVARHVLLISDNPATSAPRRILTKPDGTAEVSLRPGSYTVESDAPVAFGGKGYQWTEIIEIAAGRDRVLTLTAENAEVGDAPQRSAGTAAPMESSPSPPSTESPETRLRPFPADALDEGAKRNVFQLSAYQLSSSNFDLTFLTPPLLHVARERARKSSLIPESLAVAIDFGDYSDYVAEAPPVLIVRVTPKLTEGFWMTMARMAAYTQGAAIPPIKHFKPGFARLQALCGDAEVTPIHPYILARRLSVTDAVREGLYVFDPAAFGPHCKSVRLVMYSEKDPTKPDARVIDAPLVERVWNDFAPLRP